MNTTIQIFAPGDDLVENPDYFLKSVIFNLGGFLRNFMQSKDSGKIIGQLKEGLLPRTHVTQACFFIFYYCLGLRQRFLMQKDEDADNIVNMEFCVRKLASAVGMEVTQGDKRIPLCVSSGSMHTPRCVSLGFMRFAVDETSQLKQKETEVKADRIGIAEFGNNLVSFMQTVACNNFLIARNPICFESLSKFTLSLLSKIQQIDQKERDYNVAAGYCLPHSVFIEHSEKHPHAFSLEDGEEEDFKDIIDDYVECSDDFFVNIEFNFI
jgi:hypothetical protein